MSGSNNFLFTIVGLTAVIIAALQIGNESKENFVNVPRTVRTEKVVKGPRGEMHALNPKKLYNPEMTSKMYQVPGTFQSQLEPRFANVDFGANIKYRMPDSSHMAAPSNPLDFGDMVKEDYSHSRSAPSCGAGGVEKDSPVDTSMQPSSSQEYKDAMGSLSYSATSSELPVGDMTTFNADGQEENPIIYDRMIYANQKSHLHGQADFIRGDVFIQPACNDKHFRVSAKPAITLNSGAMGVLGGIDNSTARELWAAKHKLSGGYDKYQGGMELDFSTTGTEAQLGAGTDNLQFTAFP